MSLEELDGRIVATERQTRLGLSSTSGFAATFKQELITSETIPTSGHLSERQLISLVHDRVRDSVPIDNDDYQWCVAVKLVLYDSEIIALRKQAQKDVDKGRDSGDTGTDVDEPQERVPLRNEKELAQQLAQLPDERLKVVVHQLPVEMRQRLFEILAKERQSHPDLNDATLSAVPVVGDSHKGVEITAAPSTATEAMAVIRGLADRVRGQRAEREQVVNVLNNAIEVFNCGQDKPDTPEAKAALVRNIRSLKEAWSIESVLTEGNKSAPIGTKVSVSYEPTTKNYQQGCFRFAATHKNENGFQGSLERANSLPLKFRLAADGPDYRGLR